MVHSCSWLHDYIIKGNLPAEFHVVLDEAFRCTTQELSAHSKPRAPARLTESQDAFNYHLSLQRQVVERCFGLLVWRWGVFWRPLNVSFGSIKDLVACCCRLVHLFRFFRWSHEIYMRHRLHNWCQEDTEFKRILAAQRPDQAFDAALFDSLQEHDPADLTWTRVNNSQQPSQIIFNPRTDGLMFMRGDMRAGFRSDLVGGKRKEFTRGMETREVKRPKHSADAARARRYGEQ